MEVKILIDKNISFDGVRVVSFKKGEKHLLPSEQIQMLVECGVVLDPEMSVKDAGKKQAIITTKADADREKQEKERSIVSIPLSEYHALKSGQPKASRSEEKLKEERAQFEKELEEGKETFNQYVSDTEKWLEGEKALLKENQEESIDQLKVARDHLDKATEEFNTLCATKKEGKLGKLIDKYLADRKTIADNLLGEMEESKTILKNGYEDLDKQKEAFEKEKEEFEKTKIDGEP